MPDKVSNVYAVAGAKGGVGRTTTSINLGAALSAAGYEPVVVEVDLTMANLVDYLDVDIDVTAAPTLHDVLGGDTPLEAATYAAADGLDVVPSGAGLQRYAGVDLDDLPAVFETLQERYDVVVVDTPAGLGSTTARPIELADAVVLVSTPRIAAIRNTDQTRELATRADTDVQGFVLTMSGQGDAPCADHVAGFLDVALLGHVPEDDAVPHAQDRGEAVVEYAPHSGAAVAYRKIARGLVGSTPVVASEERSAWSESAFETLQSDGVPPGESAGTTQGSEETPPQRPDGGRLIEDGGATEPTGPSVGERASPESTDPGAAAPQSVIQKVRSTLGL